MIKLGVVPYLNVLPLLEGLEADIPRAGWKFATPRELAGDVRAGRLDVGIVSLFEALQDPPLRLVPGVAIGCDGPVRSVQLFASRPLGQVRRVLLDRSSLTSIHLAQVLARELLAIRPEWVLSDAPLKPGNDWQARGFDAVVAIGDTALAWEGRFPHALDLGEGWKRLTGLPFVFAGWVERPGLRLSPGQEAAFARARDRGLGNLDAIASAAEARPGCPCRDVRDYLGRAIQFGLGPAQRESIEQFRNRLAAHGLLVEHSPASVAASRP